MWTNFVRRKKSSYDRKNHARVFLLGTAREKNAAQEMVVMKKSRAGPNVVHQSTNTPEINWAERKLRFTL